MPKDCYSDGERKLMEFGQKIRHKLLNKILVFMTDIGINANIVTLFSLITGILSAICLAFSPLSGLILLLIHVLLDGIDGPLARLNNKASGKGSFTDTAADQIVIVAIMIAVIEMHIVSITAGIIYIFVYSTVVAFAIIRNYLDIPYSWLVRPRFIIYLWLAVEFYFLPGSLEYVIWLFNVVLIVKMLTGFIKIRKKL